MISRLHRMSLPSRKCGLKLRLQHYIPSNRTVTSFAEVWIEIPPVQSLKEVIVVTSFAEVWIEIVGGDTTGVQIPVTSFAEVWIEIVVTNPIKGLVIVTSFAEVWIEMSDLMGHLIRH